MIEIRKINIGAKFTFSNRNIVYRLVAFRQDVAIYSRFFGKPYLNRMYEISLNILVYVL